MPIARRRFTVDEYERMAEAGILGKDDRVELVEGEIVEMAPIGPPHGGSVNRLTHRFTSLLRDRVIVSMQNPVRLGTFSEPQPDLTLLRPRPDFYEKSHPEPDDVLLLVEVASSTVSYDRSIKLPLYAKWGVVQVWLVNLDVSVIEVYRWHEDGTYGEPEIVRDTDRVIIDAFPDVVITAVDVLG